MLSKTMGKAIDERVQLRVSEHFVTADDSWFGWMLGDSVSKQLRETWECNVVRELRLVEVVGVQGRDGFVF